MTKLFPDAILSNHVAVLGKTNSGKTSTGKLIVEQVVRENDARVCILDPIKSDWWGLTRAADGKRVGLPFRILGGPYGHVPVHAAAGDAVGRIVASGALRHSIIDMADFHPGEHAKFFIAFATSLFRHMQGVLYLVVEEAHMFAPKEKAGFGDENKSTHWMTRIATGARSKGIRLSVCTQRVQALHNAVLGSCETVIGHRLTLPADKKPVSDWLSGHLDRDKAKEIIASMSSLKTGEAWVCSGEAQIIKRTTFPKITTYDNSRTPTGDVKSDVRPPAVDDAALRSIIGDAVKEAEANDPKLLKRRIAELERQIAKGSDAVSTIDPKIIEEAEERGWQRARQNIAFRLGEFKGEIEQTIHTRFAPFLKEGPRVKISEMPPANILPPGMDSVDYVRKIRRGEPIEARPRKQAVKESLRHVDGDRSSLSHIDSDKPLSKAERRIMEVLAHYPKDCDKSKIALIAGYSAKGGGFNNSLSALRTRGYIEGSTSISLTGLGMANCPPVDPLPRGSDLVEFWASHPKLGKCERAVIQTLYAADGEMDKTDLADQTGYEGTGGGFNNSLSRLRTLGLIEGSKTIALSGVFFEG